jgi:hypothetical protein
MGTPVFNQRGRPSVVSERGSPSGGHPSGDPQGRSRTRGNPGWVPHVCSLVESPSGGPQGGSKGCRTRRVPQVGPPKGIP